MPLYLLPPDPPAAADAPGVRAAGRITPSPSAPGQPDFATLATGNPLAEPPEPAAAALLSLATAPNSSRRVLAWSGTAAEGLFDPHPATWRPETHAALDALCAAAAPGLAHAGARLLFRPHARHVLADPQSCLSFLRRHEGEPVGLVLDPVALLEPSMLAQASDHLARAFAALGALSDGVILTGARIDKEQERVVPTPLSQSEIDPAVLLKLLQKHCPSDTAVILASESDAALVATFRV